MQVAGFAVGCTHVTPPVGPAADEAVIRAGLTVLGNAVDLQEPFERIRAAIEEAQRH